MLDVNKLVVQQRNFFQSGQTLDITVRMEHLRRLRFAIHKHENKITQALAADLHKTASESYMSEIGMVLAELRYQLKHVKTWAKVRRVRTPLAHFPAKSFIVPEPYGVVLIMAPWNYPFQLCITPLIGAIAAGNTAIVKPSAYAAHTSEVVAELISEVFDPQYVQVVQGGRAENELLLEQRYDYIFFTGSVAVGSLVMERAAQHLTPVTLELGGKSPAIVEKTAHLKLAAKRIVFGKFLNAGQTCIAPDYVLIDESVKEQFIVHVREALEEFFPEGDLSEFPRIINKKHYTRLMSLISEEQCVIGGIGDSESLQIVPTVLEAVSLDAPIMQEEIFGPILPIISYSTVDDAISYIASNPKPLALYIFTTNKKIEQIFLNTVTFGGGCVNDTIIHVASPHMSFGGVGASGIGSYHGEASFNTFSHMKSIIKKSNFLDLSFRYHPYTKGKDRIIKKFLN